MDSSTLHAARRRRTFRQRTELLARIERGLDMPMAVLGFVWLVLLILELVKGIGPWLSALSTAIWALFVLNFAIEFVIAPHKTAYLKRNWLTALSLLAPALRLFRVLRIARAFRAARVARGLRLLRILSSVNRGLGALSSHMSRRGFGYVMGLTLIVTLAGSAGMYAFENGPDGGSLPDYGTALWWTAMIMTTMGSETWPHTVEGRLLCLLLALYAFAVFGYVTAALASFFVGREADSPGGDVAGAQDLAALVKEVQALRAEVRALAARRDSAGETRT